MRKKTASRKSKDWGRISQDMTSEGWPWVMSQKRRIETTKGSVRVAASLYVR